MKRWLNAYQTLTGDPEQLKEGLRAEVHDLLCAATGTVEDGVAVDGSFLLRLPGRFTGLDVTKTVRVTMGVATETDPPEERLRLPLRWQAEHASHAFPTFEGAIELAPLSSVLAELVLVGTYTSPLGPPGAAADAAVLLGVAERTVQRLTAALASALHETVLCQEGARFIVPARRGIRGRGCSRARYTRPSLAATRFGARRRSARTGQRPAPSW